MTRVQHPNQLGTKNAARLGDNENWKPSKTRRDWTTFQAARNRANTVLHTPQKTRARVVAPMLKCGFKGCKYPEDSGGNHYCYEICKIQMHLRCVRSFWATPDVESTLDVRLCAISRCHTPAVARRCSSSWCWVCFSNWIGPDKTL